MRTLIIGFHDEEFGKCVKILTMRLRLTTRIHLVFTKPYTTLIDNSTRGFKRVITIPFFFFSKYFATQN